MLLSQKSQQKHARTDKKACLDRQIACLDRLKGNDVYLTAGTVSIPAQIEAAVKACEAETARLGQDYYSALSASSLTAAKGPAAGKSPAPAKGKPAKEEPTAPAEVSLLDNCNEQLKARCCCRKCQCGRHALADISLPTLVDKSLPTAVDRWGLACSVSTFQGLQGLAINVAAAEWTQQPPRMLLHAYRHATLRFTYETSTQRGLQHLHHASTCLTHGPLH